MLKADCDLSEFTLSRPSLVKLPSLQQPTSPSLPASGLPSHRGRALVRFRQQGKLKELEKVDSEKGTPSPRLLPASRHSRQDQPASQPPHFVALLHSLHESMSNYPILPDRMPELTFTRPFTEDEVATAKGILQNRPSRSPLRMDSLPYSAILDIPNDALARMANECINSADVLSTWLLTIISSILKPGKGPLDPSNYRDIALESIMLKLATPLIDKRIRSWAEPSNIFPPESEWLSHEISYQ
ncbi:hypothetical protein M422DRAFT_775844 [Sphaerobolus stellatus SS14]|nr:hypothetical protein M422DRAFT_775844 [Sphaerobolus stellatus SS14]